ncbi:MAG: choice-of-anchor tandem repeat NxxGxxAF-containing protein [Planctomycetota bacterium JB042]
MLHAVRRRLGPAFAVASLAAAPAAAQSESLLTFQANLVATDGDPVPGLSAGEVFGGSGGFDNAVLDDSGRALFRARFTGGTASVATDRAYFYGSSRDDLQLVIRAGDPEPSGLIPGATLGPLGSSQISGSPRISANGIMMFGSALAGPGSGQDSAIYVGTPGSFGLLVQRGDPAPGLPGVAMDSSFASPSLQLTCVNALGLAMFKSDLSGPGVDSTNNEAWITGTPGNLTLVVRKGDVAPGGEVLADVSPGFVGQMNSSGQIAYDVSYVIGTGTTPTTNTSDRALWLYTPGAGNQEIVREGDPAPIPGTTFNRVGSEFWSINTGAATFDASGRFMASLDLDGAVTAGVDDRAIFLLSTSGHTLVARHNDPAPGLPGVAMVTFSNSSQNLAADGFVCFQTVLAGPGVDASNDSAIIAGTPGNFTIVAREGDVAPGTGGGTFGSLSGTSVKMNNAHQIQFVNSLQGGSNSGSSQWFWDETHGLQSAILTGDTIEVAPGVFKSFSVSGNVQFNNGEGRPLSWADDGTTVYRTNLSDGTRAVVSIRLGTFTALPPTISTSVGGTQNFYLNAGIAHANDNYIVLGSASGTSPGFFSGPFLIPLNPDVVTTFMATKPNLPPFANTFGILTLDGRQKASITLPPGTGIPPGFKLDWAFASANGGGLAFASEAASLEIAP